MSNKRSTEKEQFWRLVLQEHAASGFSIRKFCKQQEISEASFHAWKREIRQRDLCQNQLVPVKLAATKNDQAVIDNAANVNSPSVEIQLPGGAIVRFFEAKS